MFLGVLILLPLGAVFAAEANIPDIYYRGEVTKIQEQEEQDMGGYQATIEEVTVRITSGAEKNKEIIIERGVSADLGESQRVIQGDSVIVVKQEAAGEVEYYIVDFYRLPALSVLAAVFLSLPHQISIGTTLTTSTIFYSYWFALYTLVFANHLVFRFGRPVYNHLRHSFCISRIVRENYNTVSVYMSGKHLYDTALRGSRAVVAGTSIFIIAHA